MGAVIYAATLSIDALGVGISWGLRGSRPGAWAYGVLFLVSFVVMWLAVAFGEVLARVLPEEFGVALAGVWVIALGLWIIISALKKKDEPRGAIPAKMPLKSAVSLALVLSVDSIGAGVAATALGISAALLPPLAAAFQMAFLFIGITAVRLFKLKKQGGKTLSALSGFVLILIGIIRLV